MSIDSDSSWPPGDIFDQFQGNDGILIKTEEKNRIC